MKELRHGEEEAYVGTGRKKAQGKTSQDRGKPPSEDGSSSLGIETSKTRQSRKTRKTGETSEREQISLMRVR